MEPLQALQRLPHLPGPVPSWLQQHPGRLLARLEHLVLSPLLAHFLWLKSEAEQSQRLLSLLPEQQAARTGLKTQQLQSLALQLANAAEGEPVEAAAEACSQLLPLFELRMFALLRLQQKLLVMSLQPALLAVPEILYLSRYQTLPLVLQALCSCWQPCQVVSGQVRCLRDWQLWAAGQPLWPARLAGQGRAKAAALAGEQALAWASACQNIVSASSHQRTESQASSAQANALGSADACAGSAKHQLAPCDCLYCHLSSKRWYGRVA